MELLSIANTFTLVKLPVTVVYWCLLVLIGENCWSMRVQRFDFVNAFSYLFQDFLFSGFQGSTAVIFIHFSHRQVQHVILNSFNHFSVPKIRPRRSSKLSLIITLCYVLFMIFPLTDSYISNSSIRNDLQRRFEIHLSHYLPVFKSWLWRYHLVLWRIF